MGKRKWAMLLVVIILVIIIVSSYALSYFYSGVMLTRVGAWKNSLTGSVSVPAQSLDTVRGVCNAAADFVRSDGMVVVTLSGCDAGRLETLRDSESFNDTYAYYQISNTLAQKMFGEELYSVLKEAYTADPFYFVSRGEDEAGFLMYVAAAGSAYVQINNLTRVCDESKTAECMKRVLRAVESSTTEITAMSEFGDGFMKSCLSMAQKQRASAGICYRAQSIYGKVRQRLLARPDFKGPGKFFVLASMRIVGTWHDTAKSFEVINLLESHLK